MWFDCLVTARAMGIEPALVLLILQRLNLSNLAFE